MNENVIIQTQITTNTLMKSLDITRQ